MLVDRKDLTTGIGLLKQANNRVGCQLATVTAVSTATKLLNDDEWHHVFCVRDFSNQDIILYFDGEVDKTTNTPGSDENQTVESTLFIGSNDNVDSFYRGFMDEVLFVNEFYTASQVLQLFENGFNGTFALQNKTIQGLSFIIDANGRVGIGTDSPDVALEVDGDITSSGTITAQEIVDLTKDWEDSYKDAMMAIRNITSIQGVNESFINHSSLDHFMKVRNGRSLGRTLSTVIQGLKYLDVQIQNPPPLQQNWSAGDHYIIAKGFIDKTKAWAGNTSEALDQVTSIRTMTVDGRLVIDHDSLPVFVRTNVTVTTDEDCTERNGVVTCKTTTTMVDGRDTSALVTMLVETIKELESRNTALDARVRVLEAQS